LPNELQKNIDRFIESNGSTPNENNLAIRNITIETLDKTFQVTVVEATLEFKIGDYKGSHRFIITDSMLKEQAILGKDFITTHNIWICGNKIQIYGKDSLVCKLTKEQIILPNSEVIVQASTSNVMKMYRRAVFEPIKEFSQDVIIARSINKIENDHVNILICNNTETIRYAYPLPRADEQLEALGNARYFSSLDLGSGFWQIEMNQNDEEKTAFCVPNGLYQFKVMPMGLTNAPLTFQRMMDQILKHLNWKKCLCFFDDILIFSPTFDEHLIALDEVLSTLAQANLKVKYSKSQFALNEITFLGHRITQDGICPDPTKVSALVNIKEPTNITEVKSFIGLASYYRKYVNNFSEISLPLLKLTRKNVKFD
jgi:hypothetical protein